MWGPIAGAFARIPLSVSWALSDEPGFWKGTVDCAEPVVGVTLALHGNRLHWAKSQELPTGSYVVGEPIFGFPVSFWVGRALEDASPELTNIALYLRGAVRATMIGEVWSRTEFQIQESVSGYTGEALCLVRLSTSSPTECGFLFLARSDVRSSRKGGWRLRPALAGSARGILGEVLRGGRVGEGVVEQPDAADEAGLRTEPRS
jgi:hypothetical protein